MNIEPTRRVRGVMAARADASAIAASIAQINQEFAAFRDANDKRIAEIEARGTVDVVQAEKVDRINAELTRLEGVINAQKASVDALRIGGGGQPGESADAKAYNAAFDKWFRRGTGENDLRELQVNAALTTQSDPDGGFLVPEQMEVGIDRVLGNVSVMRELSRVIPVSSDSYSKLVNLGGTGSGWVGEEDARPATGTPTLAELAINMGEIYANPSATQRMLDDSAVDIATWLAEEVSVEFAEQEGLAFISGSGTKRPKGFLSYTMVANASYAWGKIGFVASGASGGFLTPSTTVSPADAFIDLYYALKSGYRNGASWLMSDATLGAVRKFKDGDGTPLWAPPTAETPSTILGKPVFTDDNMPEVAANAFPVAFGNWKRGYTIADRLGIRLLRDPYTNKPNVQFYTTKRVGGAVTNFEAIKVMKIST